MDNLVKNYTENRMPFSDLKKVEKMPENRPSGNESIEEIEKYGYTPSQVKDENKHLKKLYNTILKEGYNLDMKTFKIGICEDRKTNEGEYRLFLMDGQHSREIIQMLIDKGVLSNDVTVRYEIEKYDSYIQMAKAVNGHNNGRNMNNFDKSRNEDMCNTGGENFLFYSKVIKAVNEELPDSLIRICLYGQHNGERIFSKSVNEYYKEIIKSFLNLKEKCIEKGFTTDVTNQMYGATHGATAIRDFYSKVFSTLFAEKGDTISRESLLSLGLELCSIFNDALIGEYTPPSKGYTKNSIKQLCSMSQKAFKDMFKTYILNGTIKFYKRSSPTNEENSDFIKKCISKW